MLQKAKEVLVSIAMVCAGAETGNPEQKRIGGHDIGRSAEGPVKLKKGECRKSSKAEKGSAEKSIN